MRSTASQGACSRARRKIHSSTRQGMAGSLLLAEYQAATRDLFFNRSNLRYGIRRGAGVGRFLGVEVVLGVAVGVTVAVGVGVALRIVPTSRNNWSGPF